MKRVDRKRSEAWMTVNEMSKILIADLSIAAERLKDEALKYSPKEGIDWEMAFWGKTAVRTLFGLVDGLGYAMRATTVDMATELGVELSDRDRLNANVALRTSF